MRFLIQTRLRSMALEDSEPMYARESNEDMYRNFLRFVLSCAVGVVSNERRIQ